MKIVWNKNRIFIFIIITLAILASACSKSEDSMDKPVNYYMAYISKTDFDDSIQVDKVEFLGSGDEERMEELGIDPNKLDNGYYIHNPDPYLETISLGEDTQYKVLNWEDLSKHKTLSQADFIDFLDGNNPYKSREGLLFRVFTQDGDVIKLEEQYIP